MVPDTEPSINVICQYCCCSYCQSEPAAGAGWCLGAGGGGGGGQPSDMWQVKWCSVGTHFLTPRPCICRCDLG